MQTTHHPAARRITTALFTAESFNSASFIIMFTVTPILAAQLSGNDAAAGIPTTLAMLGRALIAYPMGWLMDRVGRRLGLSVGYLLTAVGAAIGTYAVIQGSFTIFLASAIFLGMARGTSEQSRFAAAEVQPESRRAKSIGLIVFAGTVGAISGPLIVPPSEALAAGLNLPGLAGPWLISIGFGLLAMLVVFAWLRPDPMEMGRTLASTGQINGTQQNTVTRTIWQMFSSPYMILAVGAMVIGQLVMTLLMVITPLHMAYHDHSTQAISGVIMAHTLGMFGLSSVTGWLIDRLGRVKLIVAGALVLVTSAGITPLSTSLPILGLALFLLGLGWNFCHIAGSSLLTDTLASGERGRAAGASEVFIALASSTGSFSTGFIFAASGIVAVSLVGLILSLALVPLTGWAITTNRRAALTAAGD